MGYSPYQNQPGLGVDLNYLNAAFRMVMICSSMTRFRSMRRSPSPNSRLVSSHSTWFGYGEQGHLLVPSERPLFVLDSPPRRDGCHLKMF